MQTGFPEIERIRSRHNRDCVSNRAGTPEPVRILSRVLLLVLAFLCLQAAAFEKRPTDKLVIHFFGSSTCGECAEIKEAILKPFARQHPEKVDLRLHDTDESDKFDLMVKLEEAYGVTSPSPQELYLPDTVLLGYETIMADAPLLLESYLVSPEKWTQPVFEGDSTGQGQAIKKRLDQFTFLGIVAAGLVDGVNPCAIATMIFLISFLATQKRKRSEVLTIGLSFTAAVFTTYLLLGVGAFKLLTSLGVYFWLSKAIKWTAVGAAAIFALYSFRDAFVYARTGKSQDIKLQLPKPLKMRIHKVISGNLSGTGLVVGAIVTGFLVTLLEAVCTGQVYLPTIILMTRNEELQLQGWLYLVFYNFLFVLPLLIVMLLAYLGMTWNQLSKATQKHLVVLKVMLGVVLTSLAVFLGFAG